MSGVRSRPIRVHPLLSVLAELLGQKLTRRSAGELETWRRREETTRMPLMADSRDPEAQTGPISVTSLQVRAAKVAVKAHSTLGEPSPPGLIRIAEEPVVRDDGSLS